ncbi:substrate-binding domain-containing protein [Micromonospora sp. LH3U1]|uniref:substrate-binding domain-containing protein n=1 Tax=Micromonospora sp. LH3U1 TaxID=3018339 RepID=UPI002349F5AE|nr:substrate-binding domain-containing protein [Micromonospora sp. LH3U1]WCN78628.1 substrate-binding domain-containing protein [Micromonospora sp. LH3U1]
MTTNRYGPHGAELGRDQAPKSHRRRSRRRSGFLVLTSIVVAGLVVAATTNYAGIIDKLSPGSSCGKGAESLRVVVAPEILPTVAAAVGKTGDACSRVDLVGEDSAITAQKGAPGAPQVWIPSSHLWLDSVDPDRRVYPIHDDYLARSPLILAVPAGVAGTPWARSGFSWATLLSGVVGGKATFSMGDPSRDLAGLLSFVAVQAAAASPGTDAGVAQLRALALRSRLLDADASAGELLRESAEKLGDRKALAELGMFPVIEQQLWMHNDGRDQPVQSLYASDIAVEADYPVAVAHQATATAVQRRLLTQFIGDLRSVETSNALVAAGFRLTGFGGPSPRVGVPKGLPLKIADPTPVADVSLGVKAAEWSRYQPQRFQVLVVIDRSGSMAAPVVVGPGRTETKATLLRSFGAVAAQTFTNDTELGLWFFGTPTANSPSTEVVVPLGPVTGTVKGETRRQAIGRKIAAYTPIPNSGTPLYKAVLEAVSYMQTKIKPDRRPIVVVLTDGRDGNSPYAKDKAKFLNQLAQNQPSVPVFSIGIGESADLDTLRAVAETTDGRAEAAQNPKDLAAAMANIFLAAASGAN